MPEVYAGRWEPERGQVCVYWPDLDETHVYLEGNFEEHKIVPSFENGPAEILYFD